MAGITVYPETRVINMYTRCNFLMAIASRRRSIVKTLSYRAIVTVILAVVTFGFTGNLYQTSTIAIVFGVLATLTYYLHERLWSRIQWK